MERIACGWWRNTLMGIAIRHDNVCVFLFSDGSNLSMAAGTWRTSNDNKNTVVAWPGIWPSNLGGRQNEQAKLALPSFLWAIRGLHCHATAPSIGQGRLAVSCVCLTELRITR